MPVIVNKEMYDSIDPFFVPFSKSSGGMSRDERIDDYVRKATHCEDLQQFKILCLIIHNLSAASGRKQPILDSRDVLIAVIQNLSDVSFTTHRRRLIAEAIKYGKLSDRGQFLL